MTMSQYLCKTQAALEVTLGVATMESKAEQLWGEWHGLNIFPTSKEACRPMGLQKATGTLVKRQCVMEP